jgi:uncharacterized protein (DUF2235 family)
MGKNIIICSDGTGNTANKDRGTNVFKLFEAVDLNGHLVDPKLTLQVALYDDGVGTESFLPLKLIGGAFGWGLKRNVLNLYTGLVRIYDPGDRVYLFGFSRGAFTVRTLAGLIAQAGILEWEPLNTTEAMTKAVAALYNTYRKGYRTWLWRMLHGKSEDAVKAAAKTAMDEFTKLHPSNDADIHFVGVWDTVDSVGGPFHISNLINSVIHRFKFPDYKLSPKIQHGVQALSIDDARAEFVPRLWEANDKVEQVWFAGVHSNVGGGYPKQGMSLVTMDWMTQKASENGLRMLEDDRRRYWEHGSVDDKLYDSRAGLGVFYRWWPRDMQRLCTKQKAACPPKVHLSVLERIAHGTDGYAPGTLAPQVEVVFTPSGDDVQDQALEVRVKAVNAVLTKVLAGSENLPKVGGTIVIGQFAYYIYVASCLAVILAASVPPDAGSRLNPWTVLKNAASLVYDAVTGQWGPIGDSMKRLFSDPALLLTLLLGFAIAAILASYVDNVRSRAFSGFWHKSRHDLREALKAALESMRGGPPPPPPANPSMSAGA